MSAATTTPPAATNGVHASPVEYVKALPPEDKQAVFLSLLREALAENGDAGLLPVDDENGKPFGYYVPPKAAAEIAERELPKLSPERERELADRLTRLHTAVPIEQVISELRGQAEQARTAQP
ncbi:hypothetical protein [Gemmata sp.]|uniref:hypothetical protein n=1 Tax=Gemmata sp. TaxID=1914242 RepID=UPI003F708BD1